MMKIIGLMKKLVIVFCIAWAILGIANTGYAIGQLNWLERLNFSPTGVQQNAGDIFNQGAVKASKSKDIPHPDVAILFVEDEQGLLKALPLSYWLYPTYLLPASSKYFTPNGTVKDNVNESLQQATTKPEGKVIFFVGSMTTLKNNAAQLANYKQTVIDHVNQDYFVVLEKK